MIDISLARSVAIGSAFQPVMDGEPQWASLALKVMSAPTSPAIISDVGDDLPSRRAFLDFRGKRAEFTLGADLKSCEILLGVSLKSGDIFLGSELVPSPALPLSQQAHDH